MSLFTFSAPNGSIVVMPFNAPLNNLNNRSANVAGEYTASMSTRFFAAVIDQILTAALLFILQAFKLINLNAGSKMRDVVVCMAALCLYQYFFLATRAATPGKQIFGLTIVAAETTGRRPASEAAIVKRSIFGPLMMILYPLPFAISFLRADRRQLADLLSGTKVIGRDHSTKSSRPVIAALLAILSIPTILQISYLIFLGGSHARKDRVAIETATGENLSTAYHIAPETPLNIETVAAVLAKNAEHPLAGLWKSDCKEDFGDALISNSKVQGRYWKVFCGPGGCSQIGAKSVSLDDGTLKIIDSKTLQIVTTRSFRCVAGRAEQFQEATPQPTPTPSPALTNAPSTANVANSTASASTWLAISINGKQQEALHLGDTYKFEISNVPAATKIVARCDGAPGCASWFLLGAGDIKPDANGTVKLQGQFPPNWNIPLTKYTLWVETEGGSAASNRVVLTLEAKIEKQRPFPPAAVGSGLQLTVSDALETSIELGVGNAIYHVDGGLPGQLLIAHCDWPPEISARKTPNYVWMFPTGNTLDSNGALETSIGIGASMPAGKYVVWLTTSDGKFTSNKVTLNLIGGKK